MWKCLTSGNIPIHPVLRGIPALLASVVPFVRNVLHKLANYSHSTSPIKSTARMKMKTSGHQGKSRVAIGRASRCARGLRGCAGARFAWLCRDIIALFYSAEPQVAEIFSPRRGPCVDITNSPSVLSCQRVSKTYCSTARRPQQPAGPTAAPRYETPHHAQHTDCANVLFTSDYCSQATSHAGYAPPWREAHRGSGGRGARTQAPAAGDYGQ